MRIKQLRVIWISTKLLVVCSADDGLKIIYVSWIINNEHVTKYTNNSQVYACITLHVLYTHNYN